MRHLLLTIAASVCVAMYTTAQEKQAKFYKLYGPGVFVNVDRRALFQSGTLEEGFLQYVGKRFVYSKELWKQLHSRLFHIDCTITRSGKVSDVSVSVPHRGGKSGDVAVEAPQEVTDQISLLCDDMPRLVPALVKGNEVASRYSTTIRVVGTYDGTCLPYSFTPWIRKVKAVAADRNYKDGMARHEADKKIARLDEAADVVPEYARASSAYVRLLAAVGRHADAYRHATVEAASYAANDWWPSKDADAVLKYAHSDNYEGKTEVWLRLLQSAVAYDGVMPADTIARAAATARDLVCQKIENHDIVNFDFPGMESGDYTRYRNLMQEKYSLAMSSYGALDPDERAALDHEQVSGKSMVMIDKYMSQGKISSARIVQINHELAQIHHKSFGTPTIDNIPGLAVNTARMYAVNALLEYLDGGTAAQDRYLRSAIEGDGKPYAKELEALRSAIARAALTDADRKAVARCIAAFAPIKGIDDAKAFYELRKRVCAAYPIEWLSK